MQSPTMSGRDRLLLVAFLIPVRALLLGTFVLSSQVGKAVIREMPVNMPHRKSAGCTRIF